MTPRPSSRAFALVATLAGGWLAASAVPAHDPPRTPVADGRAIVFPDTAELRTLIVDLHTHSVFSDGHVWPSIRVGEAILDGLDALAITEHLEYQPHLADIPHPDRNRAYEEALASLPPDSDLVLIAGSEITRAEPLGHMNAVFIQDANALFRADPPAEPFDSRAYFVNAGAWPAQEAVDAANEQGAFVFWNHSWSNFSDARSTLIDFHRENAVAGKLHGIEIANGRTYSAESFQIALDFDLALIGVSDVHNLIDWDYEPHKGGHRPVNLVFAAGKTAEAIRQALFDRRTAVWYKNLLIGRPRELDPLLAASVTIESASYPGRGAVLELVLANHSDARFQLENQSDYSLVGSADIFELAPHAETTLRVRTGGRLADMTLEVAVLNALTAPTEHPVMRLEIAVQPVSAP